MASPIGPVLVAGDESGVRFVWFEEGTNCSPFPPEKTDDWTEDSVFLAAATRQIAEYFDGKRQSFDLILSPQGTRFQTKVWDALREIPFGTTVTYRSIAEKVGNPKAVRAVGAAIGRNPIPIAIPCHRVIGSDGSLTGFRGGIPLKKFLLGIEGAIRE